MFVTLGIMFCLEFSMRPLGDANGNNGDETISPLSYELKNTVNFLGVSALRKGQ